MSHPTFITDIARQHIRIEGVDYSAAEAHSRQEGQLSLLQETFYTRYGANSFQASLADFLHEWFDDHDTVLVHTSGSTGTPKPLRVEKQRMMQSAMLTVRFLGLHTGDTALLCMPLKYIAGKMVVVRALVAGLDLLPVTPSGHPLAQTSTTPVFAAMIPMQVYNSLQVPEEKERLQQIRHLIIGGGAIDTSLGKQLLSFPHAVWSTYGMTETLSHIALRRLNGPEASDWYTPFQHVKLSLSPENTLTIEAPAVCPEILTTNDICEFNAQGQFHILGRKDNTINTGGVKVQIEQVENALRATLSCPFQVTAVPDLKFGERIVLLLEDPEAACPESVLTEAFHTLSPYWRPKQVFRIRQLPQTGTGKPDRATARKLAKEIAEKETK